MSRDNHFLDAICSEDIGNIAPLLACINLNRGDRLSEDGEKLHSVYLPIDSILSVITVMKSGQQVESRTIGRESGYGLLHALGSQITYERMEVQVSGRAWRIPLEDLRRVAQQSSTLTHAIVAHGQATIVQCAQGVACNALHSVEHRLCRWLLMTQDRLGADVLPLTQEHLSIMLGVQRTTVTAVASEMQRRGHISYARGKIRILDRAKLKQEACECYDAITNSVRTMLQP